ncbi:MAG: endonuclease [Bacillaceae bacterium]|nr:endonuclease [Bacillaceae bacterium]
MARRPSAFILQKRRKPWKISQSAVAHSFQKNWRIEVKHHYPLIYRKLYGHYGPQNWWPADTPFEMMIGAILVQNTSWRNVEKAINRLKPFLEPRKLDDLPEEKIAELIRPSGYYNIKARRIRSFLSWFKTYAYDLDRIKEREKAALREELLNVKGIGPETADAILVYAFEKPVFIVDAYARRIFHRIGYDMPASYDRFQRQVEAQFPPDAKIFNEFHALLVEHGKTHCRTVPLCGGCPLADICQKRK